jgi:hypothetical protein
MNRYGDKGSPYRNPPVGLKNSVLPPLISKADETVDIHSIIHVTNLSSKPKFHNTFNKNGQLTLS